MTELYTIEGTQIATSPPLPGQVWQVQDALKDTTNEGKEGERKERQADK